MTAEERLEVIERKCSALERRMGEVYASTADLSSLQSDVEALRAAFTRAADEIAASVTKAKHAAAEAAQMALECKAAARDYRNTHGAVLEVSDYATAAKRNMARVGEHATNVCDALIRAVRLAEVLADGVKPEVPANGGSSFLESGRGG